MIYRFAGNTASKAIQVHEKVVHAIRFVPTSALGDGLLISGGTDNRVVISNPASMEIVKEVKLANTVKSVDMLGSKVLAGLRNGGIVEVDMAP